MPFTSSSSYTCPANGPMILNWIWSCFQSTTGSPFFSKIYVICCIRAILLSNGCSRILSKFLSTFHWNMTFTRIGRNSGFGVDFFMCSSYEATRHCIDLSNFESMFDNCYAIAKLSVSCLMRCSSVAPYTSSNLALNYPFIFCFKSFFSLYIPSKYYWYANRPSLRLSEKTVYMGPRSISS